MIPLTDAELSQLRALHALGDVSAGELEELHPDALRVLALDEALYRPGRFGDPLPPAMAAELARR